MQVKSYFLNFFCCTRSLVFLSAKSNSGLPINADSICLGSVFPCTSVADILVESLTVFIAKIPMVGRETVEVRMKEVYLERHVAAELFIITRRITNQLFIVGCLNVAQEMVDN